mgnify:CR=1 FL=1
MATILETKQALSDIRNELRKEQQHGVELARNPDATLEEITVQSALLDTLQAREALLMRDLERQESEGRNRAEKGMQDRKPGSSFGCMGEFLKSVRDACTPGTSADRRLFRVADTATGANEGTGADGGYLVPPEYADGIIDLVRGESVLYPQARKVPISGNRLIEMYLAESSRKDPSSGRHGGVLAYWKGEADQYDAVKAQFGERTTNLQKLTAYCPVTEELLEDYPAMEATINDLVGREFAFKADDAMLNGTGNLMPLGILATNSGTPAQNNGALVTIDKESGQAAKTLMFENIIKMYNALIAQNRSNAAWYINQDLEILLMQLTMPTGSIKSTGDSAVEKIVGQSGAPVYLPAGAYGNAEARLFNLPVRPIEQCGALGEKGDIVLMDASQYLWIERTGITRQSSMHVRFDYDETVFKFTWRAGGRPDWMNKIEAYKGTTARSPYVCLAERA